MSGRITSSCSDIFECRSIALAFIFSIFASISSLSPSGSLGLLADFAKSRRAKLIDRGFFASEFDALPLNQGLSHRLRLREIKQGLANQIVSTFDRSGSLRSTRYQHSTQAQSRPNRLRIRDPSRLRFLSIV